MRIFAENPINHGFHWIFGKYAFIVSENPMNHGFHQILRQNAVVKAYGRLLNYCNFAKIRSKNLKS